MYLLPTVVWYLCYFCYSVVSFGVYRSLSMSTTHFQSDILPSPFVIADQVINSLVYGSFFEEPTALLKYFLVPKTVRWTSKSYLLWSLYSYLQLVQEYNMIVYIWQEKIKIPMLSGDDGVEYVLGKKITYAHIPLENILDFDYQTDINFAMDNEFRSQHLTYQSILGMKVIPLCLPEDWLTVPAHRILLTQLLDNFDKKKIACVLIDDFEIEENDSQTDMLADRDSLSDFYNQFIQGRGQESHLLAIQPCTDEEDMKSSWWVLGGI